MTKSDKKMGLVKAAVQRRAEIGADPKYGTPHKQRERKFKAALTWTEIVEKRLDIEAVNVTEMRAQIERACEMVARHAAQITKAAGTPSRYDHTYTLVNWNSKKISMKVENMKLEELK